jgi:hypothetical protein
MSDSSRWTFERKSSPKWSHRIKVSGLHGWVALTVLTAAGVGIPFTTPMLPGHSHALRAAQQSIAPRPDPPGTIDGAKNPELIPDQLAYKMMLMALSVPPNATDQQKRRQQARLERIHLSADDAKALLGLAAQFREGKSSIDTQVSEIHKRNFMPHPDSTDWEGLKGLRSREIQLLLDTTARIPQLLTERGVSNVSADLLNVKRHIKIFPEPHAATY